MTEQRFEKVVEYRWGDGTIFKSRINGIKSYWWGLLIDWGTALFLTIVIPVVILLMRCHVKKKVYWRKIKK